jgi:hypothetical protein
MAILCKVHVYLWVNTLGGASFMFFSPELCSNELPKGLKYQKYFSILAKFLNFTPKNIIFKHFCLQ